MNESARGVCHLPHREPAWIARHGIIGGLAFSFPGVAPSSDAASGGMGVIEDRPWMKELTTQSWDSTSHSFS